MMKHPLFQINTPLPTLRIVFAAACFAALTSCANSPGPPRTAPAGPVPSDVSGLIGNTVVMVGNGIDIRVKLHADGTYDQDDVNGFPTKGTWKEENGELCYTPTKPLPGNPTYFCAKHMDGKQVGDRWAERWPDGRTFRGQVVAGQ
jgi:hypothetical protein